MKSSDTSYHRTSFQELKSRVGIDDVAYALGYRLDKKAGVGRFYEMVLLEGNSKKDTLVIRNTPNKASQTYFRRDGSKGDVITLIRENLNSFNVSGSDEWKKVAAVLSSFANLPIDDSKEEIRQKFFSASNSEFQPGRYEVKELDLSNIPSLLKSRGFDSRTVRDFMPFVKLISDKDNKNFKGFNIGFPYTSESNTVSGYEIRGHGGFKSKAAGTNSASSAWFAEIPNGNTELVKNVYLFESAFDAMAFYQINRDRLDFPAALVSIGGTFSDSQILCVRGRYPNAKLVDCFDNDIPGRVNGLRLISLAEAIPMKINKTESGINVEAKGKIFTLCLNDSLQKELSDHICIQRKTSQWTPPEGYKDWNDCLLGKKQTLSPMPNKNDRNENLYKKRNSMSL